MRKIIFAAAALAAAIAAPASATLVTSFEGGKSSPDAASGFSVVNDFNGATAMSSVTGTNYKIMSGTTAGVGAQPANSSPSGTPYLAVQAGGSATFAFAANVAAFQFDWGSVDTFNSLIVNYVLNGVAGTQTYIPDSAGFLAPANGNQTVAGTNGRFTVAGTAGEIFTSVTFADKTTNAFEVDNIATRTAVPEPASWAMMIVGFGAVGGAMRRKRTLAFA